MSHKLKLSVTNPVTNPVTNDPLHPYRDLWFYQGCGLSLVITLNVTKNVLYKDKNMLQSSILDQPRSIRIFS